MEGTIELLPFDHLSFFSAWVFFELLLLLDWAAIVKNFEDLYTNWNKIRWKKDILCSLKPSPFIVLESRTEIQGPLDTHECMQSGVYIWLSPARTSLGYMIYPLLFCTKVVGRTDVQHLFEIFSIKKMIYAHNERHVATGDYYFSIVKVYQLATNIRSLVQTFLFGILQKLLICDVEPSLFT